jgi:hypothetical protein
MAWDITGIGSILDFGGKIIDKIFPDPTAAAAAKLELYKAQQAGEFKELELQAEVAKAQIAVNAVEAASSSTFVAGARPFIMWVCAFALMYVSILEPIARFVATVAYHYSGAYPEIDTTITMQVLVGLLGIGAMRNYDKKQGTDTKTVG